MLTRWIPSSTILPTLAIPYSDRPIQTPTRLSNGTSSGDAMRAWEFINEGKVPFSSDIIADVRQAFDLGYPLKEIGQLTDLTVPKVSYILDKYHKDRNKRIDNIAQAATPEDKVEIARLWQAGENIRNIASKFAVDRTTVERWIDEKLGPGTVDRDNQQRRTLPSSD